MREPRADHIPMENAARPSSTNESDRPAAPGADGGRKPLGARFSRLRQSTAARRIRSKLILLHTGFSLTLAAILLVALRAPVDRLVREEEWRECRIGMELLRAAPVVAANFDMEGMELRMGSAESLGLSVADAVEARAAEGEIVRRVLPDGRQMAVVFDPESGRYFTSAVRLPGARAAVQQLSMLIILSLLAVYGLIALVLEVFVLPRQVYRPIERLRLADAAVQRGVREEELIPERDIPADELGEVMRTRNASILTIRRQERAIAEALEQLEAAAAELKMKNHLLETARRNLIDQDRLVSLGMLSAGIAHELNTPLAVLKGSVEQLAARVGGNDGADSERVALMLRVIRRLERLSEGLLDFARVRPPSMDVVQLRDVVEEAWTLVSLDRGAQAIEFTCALSADAKALGDADRLLQVFVNLLRNAVDAIDRSHGTGRGRIKVTEERSRREGRDWISVMVADNGPGIDPAVLPRLFEPFASTRLDAEGTGLGLAVAEGIVREHGGLLLARNRAEETGGGAVFEVVLPVAVESPPEEARTRGPITLAAETGGT